MAFQIILDGAVLRDVGRGTGDDPQIGGGKNYPQISQIFADFRKTRCGVDAQSADHRSPILV